MSRGLSVNPISVRVIMYITLVVSWCAAFLFPPRNCLLLPLRISSGGYGQFNKTRVVRPRHTFSVQGYNGGYNEAQLAAILSACVSLLLVDPGFFSQRSNTGELHQEFQSMHWFSSRRRLDIAIPQVQLYVHLDVCKKVLKCLKGGKRTATACFLLAVRKDCLEVYMVIFGALPFMNHKCDRVPTKT